MLFCPPVDEVCESVCVCVSCVAAMLVEGSMVRSIVVSSLYALSGHMLPTGQR